MADVHTSPPPVATAISALRLRAIAEAAAGLAAGQVGHLVCASDGELRFRAPDDPAADGDVLVAELSGHDDMAWQWPTSFDVVLDTAPEDAPGPGRGSPGSVRREYDACFWAPSAVRKFVLPYYLPLLGPARVTAMARRLATGRYAAVLHGIYSEPDVVGARGQVGPLGRQAREPFVVVPAAAAALMPPSAPADGARSLRSAPPGPLRPLSEILDDS